METKVCTKCKIEKSVCEFRVDKSKKDGLYSSCKNCCSNKRLNNREYHIKRSKKWYEENSLEFNKERYKKIKNNPEKIEKLKEAQKNWEKNNRKKRNEYAVNKRRNDSSSRLIENVRTRIRVYLKNKNIIKNNTTYEIVGCSPEFLKLHIEKQFIKEMSWDLMGKYIHIDHIIPLSSAKTEEEIYELCHYTNLQPLWAKDNLSKGSKIL